MNGLVFLMGGSSVRYGKNKLFERLGDRFVWELSFDTFLATELIDVICVVVDEGLRASLSEKFERAGYTSRVIFAAPGRERMFSVLNGLEALAMMQVENVFIHDAARPLVSSKLIKRIWRYLAEYQAVVPGLKVRGTIKRVCDDGFIEATIDRSSLVEVQTPQAFRFAPLHSGYREAVETGRMFTDDAAVWEEFCDGPVFVCEGESVNIKLTYPEDIRLVYAFYDQ